MLHQDAMTKINRMRSSECGIQNMNSVLNEGKL